MYITYIEMQLADLVENLDYIDNQSRIINLRLKMI